MIYVMVWYKTSWFLLKASYISRMSCHMSAGARGRRAATRLPAEMTETADHSTPEEEKETEADRLNKQLDAIKKQLNEEIKITVSGAASNHNYKKYPESGLSYPILSLNIPNSLFLLWSKRNKIESKLGVAETPLINSLSTESMGNFMSLNTTSTTLIQRLRSKQSRFLSNYRKLGGTKQNKLQSQFTNMILLQEEVIPSNGIVNSQVCIYPCMQRTS